MAAEGAHFLLQGGCMRPLLRNGEVLPILAADGGKVGPGDVVLYRIGEKRLLHRVWRGDSKSLWMKDDTGSVDLHRIPRRRVLGLLDARYPLSRGPAGLAWSCLCTAVFTACRAVKQLVPGVE